MAYESCSADDLADHFFICPVCWDFFKEPELFSCPLPGNSSQWETKGARECPVCRRKSSMDHHPVIPTLKNQCEALLKKELRIKLKHLRGKLKTYEEVKLITDQTAVYIKTQAQHTERQIKEGFEKLHQFLRDEEAARIAALREEEEQKSQMMKDEIKKMSIEMSSLSDRIRAIEEEMASSGYAFLRNYKSTVERAQCPLQYPERLSGALLCVAKHLGNLKFRVWEKMQNIVQYTPVTLDSNTAAPCLILSEDLTSVRHVDEIQQLPDNPERFNGTGVLGSEGFNSGTHFWDVDVGGSTYWSVGVMTKFLRGKMNDKWRMWSVWHCAYYQSYASLFPAFYIKQKLQRIRVKLDWDRGELCFSDPDSNTHLHTFTHTFTERLFPYFEGKVSPLMILPVNVSVMVEQPSLPSLDESV